MIEVMYDAETNVLVLKEPGFIGSVEGYRYIYPVDVENNLAKLLIDIERINQLIYIGDL